MSYELKKVVVIGAGGKMGMRVSRNLQNSDYEVSYCETFPAAQARVTEAGRSLSDANDVVPGCDVLILAVPDIALGDISAQYVPMLRSGATMLTLDPAAAYAGLLAERDDVYSAVAHPCHPSVFLLRRTEEELADAFGGIAAEQDVVAAFEKGTDEQKAELGKVIEVMYGPVGTIHWETVEQIAYLEPTLVETVTCMLAVFMKEALEETVKRTGVSRGAAEAMFNGHVQVALSNVFCGANPFSDACLIAMDYGRETIIRPDWKKIFDQDDLNRVIAKMLKIDAVRRAAA